MKSAVRIRSGPPAVCPAQRVFLSEIDDLGGVVASEAFDCCRIRKDCCEAHLRRLSSRTHDLLIPARDVMRIGLALTREDTMRRTLAILATATLVATAVPQAAMAEERVCRGTIGATTVDNLKVPQSATCTLKGTKVKGTIKVNRGARLEAINVNVIGNVQGENARNVIVRRGSRVGGSVQVVQGKRARIAYSRVNGDILYDDQRGEVIARSNTVGGNVQAFQNTGGVRIRGNVIDGNLQCKANRPPPTGGNNKVQGNKEDQCKRL